MICCAAEEATTLRRYEKSNGATASLYGVVL